MAVNEVQTVSRIAAGTHTEDGMRPDPKPIMRIAGFDPGGNNLARRVGGRVLSSPGQGFGCGTARLG